VNISFIPINTKEARDRERVREKFQEDSSQEQGEWRISLTL